MMPEYRRLPEIEQEVLRKFADTFISRWDMYPFQREDGSYVCVKKPLLLAMVEAHIRGKVTIGAYALDQESRATWLCLDADDDPGFNGLLRVAQFLTDGRQPSYLERSRRGGHLWLFTEPLPALNIRRFGKWLLSEHGLSHVELYPKQDTLHVGPGSLVRLPLGIHQKSGKRYHFIEVDGTPLAPTVREQLALLSDPDRVSLTYIDGVLAALPEPKLYFPTPAFRRKDARGATPSERIKNRISVLDFVRNYVDLDSTNRGLCPFHNDHKQSFGVSEDGNYWNCWAGCSGGSVIDFWMKWRELHGHDPSFTETLKELANMLLEPLP